MSPRRYRSGRRATAAEETRERIVAAAVRALSASGEHPAFSLESVATAAGVTRLTVYNQFGSRRALLESAFDKLAEQGGLFRIGDVMAGPDASAGLAQIIRVFCDFWSGHGSAARRLLDAAVHDRELKDSLSGRQERRRQIMSRLVGRMAQSGEVAPDAVRDVVDVLFVLTSVEVFLALKVGRRSTAAVCRLVQELAADVIARGASKRR
jgi:AcrR family transcriptional regulator